ncbi:MAG: thioredoxin family protein [Planctomycetaceae bacterium]
MRLRNIALGFCLTALAASAACVEATPTPEKGQPKAPKVWRTDFAAAQKEAQRLGRPMLVHFFAEWCGPCKQMDAEVLNSVELARQLENRFIAVKINSDHNLDLVERFDVQTLPTDLFIEPDGRIIVRSDSYHGRQEYLAQVARAEARWTQAQSVRIAKDRTPAKAPDNKQDTPSKAAPKTDNQQPNPPQVVASPTPFVGMDGFSPVSLALQRKWVRGDSRYAAVYKETTYHMADAGELAAFNQNPDRYTPRLLGCDPVVLWKTDRAFRGMTQYGAFYNSELYLFVSPESRAEFKRMPERYIRARHVLRPDQIENENLRRAAIESEASPH